VSRQQYEGRVESANERGIKVNGEWRNVSKFHPVTLPPRGSVVRVETDSFGYIRSIEVLEPPPGTNGTTGVNKRPTDTQRNTTISRLAVLKAAATFASTRQDIKSSDVLRIAQAWLAWVQEDT
jgi:hypothetical protein